MKRQLLFVLALPMILGLAGCPAPGPSGPTEPSAAPTATATSTVSSTATRSFTPTATPTASETPTATSSPTITDTPTVTGTPTQTDTPTDTPTCRIGIAATLAGDFNSDALDVLIFRYQAPETGSIYSMTGQLTSGGSGPYYFQYGVYADDGAGNPTNLLGSTAVTSFPASTAFSIQTLSFGSPIAITAGNYYWLAFFGNVALYDDLSTTNDYRQIAMPGGSTPMPSSPAPVSISGLIPGQPIFYLYGTTCP